MVRDLLRVLARHRFLTVLALLLSIAISTAGFLVTPPKFESKAQVLLLPPVIVTTDGPSNPFLQLGGSLLQTADIVRVSVTDQATGEAVASAGGSTTYEVVPSTAENSGPVLIVTADARTASQAHQTVQILLDTISARLATLQTVSGAPRSTWIDSTVLVSPNTGDRQYETPIRIAVGALVVTASLFLGLILLYDRARRRLRPRAPQPVDVASRLDDADERLSGHLVP